MDKNEMNEPAVRYESIPTSTVKPYEPTPEELASIERADEDIKEGRVYTEEQMDGFFKEWLK